MPDLFIEKFNDTDCASHARQTKYLEMGVFICKDLVSVRKIPKIAPGTILDKFEVFLLFLLQVKSLLFLLQVKFLLLADSSVRINLYEICLLSKGEYVIGE